MPWMIGTRENKDAGTVELHITVVVGGVIAPLRIHRGAETFFFFGSPKRVPCS